MTIYIIRHTHALDGYNPHITLRGRAMANALSNTLQHVPIDACWVSTMHRAKETFELFKNKNEIPAIIADEFMEIDKSIIGEVTSEPVDASKVASDLTRANHVIERIYKAVEQPQNIAFFTHENMMRFVIMTLEKKPVNEGYRVDVDFCDVYAINNIGGTLTIKMLRF